jgi:hypothetical protein
MIGATERMNGEQNNNLIVNKHFELQFKTLQIVPRNVDALERLLKIEERREKKGKFSGIKERIRVAHRNQEAFNILPLYIFLSCFIGSNFSMYLFYIICPLSG